LVMCATAPIVRTSLGGSAATVRMPGKIVAHNRMEQK
jgi:hypothetical protein